MINQEEYKKLNDQLEEVVDNFIDIIEKFEKTNNPSLTEITNVKTMFVSMIEEQFFAHKVNQGY